MVVVHKPEEVDGLWPAHFVEPDCLTVIFAAIDRRFSFCCCCGCTSFFIGATGACCGQLVGAVLALCCCFSAADCSNSVANCFIFCKCEFLLLHAMYCLNLP
jgi:hypothetical protein